MPKQDLKSKLAEAAVTPRPVSPESPGTLPRLLLLLLFAGSGCSALIYEIVWYQLLQLVIGSSAISLGVLLATFMGGLCAGSLTLPRLKWAQGQHPLRVYAKVEFGIALCGVLVLFGMPLVDGVYTAAAGHGLPAVLLRALVAGLCLIPPTFLMGASLPAASRWIETTPEGVSWMGMLYGANTGGAVFGCLLAGFYLLRVFGLCQLLLTFAIAWTGFMISESLPYWPVNPLLSTSPWYTFQIDMARCLWAILPAAILWGASFPLALAAAARKDEDAGRLV